MNPSISRARAPLAARWLVMTLPLALAVPAALTQPAWAQSRGVRRAARKTQKAQSSREPRHWSTIEHNRAMDLRKPLILVSDHDDTLVPSWKLTRGPATNMSPEMKDVLARAARRGDTHIIISSGSPLHKLEVFYDGTKADLLGNFGMQSRVDGRHEEDPVAAAARGSVTRLADRAEKLAVDQGLERDVVRRKDTSISFHQGHLSEAQWKRYSGDLLHLIEAEPKLEAHVKGESVEVVPKGAGSKRASIDRWLRLKYGDNWKDKVNLIYIGDSGGKGGGDEPAFKLAREHGGFGILVRHGAAHDPDTAADHYANDMADVQALLGWIADRPVAPKRARRRRAHKGGQK